MYKEIEKNLDKHTVCLRVDADMAYVIDLADIHYGAQSCLKDRLKKIVNYILTKPNLYVIIGGDCTEGSHLTSTSSVFDEECHGLEQVQLLYKILKPLADEGRILFVRSGNHGLSRSKKTTGIAPEEVLAGMLSVPFMRGAGFVSLKCRKNSYLIGTWHSKKKADKFQWVEANVNFFEHHHKVEQNTNLTVKRNPYADKWIVRPTINVQCGSFLSWAGYAMDEGYQPLPNHTPVACFSGELNKWKCFVLDDIGMLDYQSTTIQSH